MSLSTALALSEATRRALPLFPKCATPAELLSVVLTFVHEESDVALSGAEANAIALRFLTEEMADRAGLDAAQAPELERDFLRWAEHIVLLYAPIPPVRVFENGVELR